MSETIQERMARKCAEKYSVLNPKNIVENNHEELIDLLINIVKNIPTGLNKSRKKNSKSKRDKEKVDNSWNLRVQYLYHKLRLPTQKDKSDNALVQYKKYRQVQFDYDYYVMPYNDDMVYEVEIFIMFNEAMYKQNFRDMLMYNTKVELQQMLLLHPEIAVTPAIERILAYDGPPPVAEPGKEKEIQYSLIKSLKLYIPVNLNGCYHIAGRRYYNGYFMWKPNMLTSTGKLTVEHQGSGSVSFIYENKDVVTHEVFSKPYNPFIYAEPESWDEVKPIFENDVDDDALEVIENTFKEYKDMVAKNAVVKPIDKALAEIDVDDIYASIITYYNVRYKDPNDREISLCKYFSLTNSHKPSVVHAIRDCIPKFNNNEPKSADRKWNVHPGSLITAITCKKQYPMYDKVNPVDIFLMLSYTKTDSDKKMKDENRNIEDSELFTICAIYASGTDVGSAGCICPSTTTKIVW